MRGVKIFTGRLFFTNTFETTTEVALRLTLTLMWNKVRHLNHSQKQRITSNLFTAVAAGAVLTVAGPTLLPCPAYDQNDKSAFLEEQKKIQKKKVVIVKKRKQDTMSTE